MSRRVAWVLALLLAPVVLVAGPGAPSAQAATRYGSAVTWSEKWNLLPAPNGSGAIACDVAAQWVFDGFMQTVRSTGRCTRGGLLVGIGGEQDIELVYTGHEPTTGAVCQFWNARTDETNISATWTIEGRQGARTQAPGTLDQTPPPIVGSCDVDRVCFLFVEDRGGLGDDKEHSGCLSVAVGYPKVATPAPTTCAAGTVTKPALAATTTDTYQSYNYSWIRQRAFSANVTSSTSTSRSWVTYAVIRLSSSGAAGHPPNNPDYNSNDYDWGTFGQKFYRSNTSPPQNASGFPILVTNRLSQPYGGTPVSPGTTVTLNDTAWVTHQVGTQAALDAHVDGVIIGFGVYARRLDTQEDNYLPQDKATGLLGVTRPSMCSWYWGTQIATPTDGAGTPAGPIGSTEPGTDAPAPSPGAPTTGDDSAGCNFSVTNPSTWASAGMCAAVGLLGSIWEAIKSVADAVRSLLGAILGIPASILNGLKSLLIPSPGYLEGKVAQVKDAWAQTPPGKIVGTYTALPSKFAVPASSDCNGLVIPLDFPMTGQNVSFKPFSTCAGWAANLATIVRVGLRAGIYLGCLIVCLRVLAASMGLQLQFGSGRDD